MAAGIMAATLSSSSNGLLDRLRPDVRQRLVAQATRVTLNRDDLLAEPGAGTTWTYLLLSGLISLQAMTEDGNTIEVAMIGRDGVVNLPLAALAAPNVSSMHAAVVVVRGEALRLRPDTLQTEFEHNASVQRALLQHWYGLMLAIARGSACHRFHTARQRLARWLLEASDRIENASIEMTQERLANALGIQRTGVTSASVALQDTGAIKSRHGSITLLDRRRLTEIACECYRRVSTASRSEI